MEVRLTKKLFRFAMVDVAERNTIYRKSENLSVFEKAFLQVLGDTLRSPLSGTAFWDGCTYVWQDQKSHEQKGIYLSDGGDVMYFDCKDDVFARLVDVDLRFPKIYNDTKMRYLPCDNFIKL